MSSLKKIVSHPAVKNVNLTHMQSFDYVTYEVQLNEGFEFMECSFICEESLIDIWDNLSLVTFNENNK